MNNLRNQSTSFPNKRKTQFSFQESNKAKKCQQHFNKYCPIVLAPVRTHATIKYFTNPLIPESDWPLSGGPRKSQLIAVTYADGAIVAARLSLTRTADKGTAT